MLPSLKKEYLFYKTKRAQCLYLLHSKRMIYRQLMCFISCFLGLMFSVFAQDSLHRAFMPITVRGSLFYDFPQSFGATAGATLPIGSRHFTITKKGRQKEKYSDFITASDAGFYRYPFNHTGVFLFQSVGYRHYKTKPYYFEWLVTVGALRTFYDGTVYSVNENGDVTKLPHYGRLYAITGFTAVFGHDFERSLKPIPVSVLLQPSLWIQYPYNSFVLPHVSLQLSVSYQLPHFSVAVRQKQINRTHSA